MPADTFEKDPDICLVYRRRKSGGQVVTHAGPEAGPEAAGSDPKICADGDSWINILWPWSGAFGYNKTFFDCLQDDGYHNTSVAWPGDTFEDMVAKKDYKQPIQSGIFDYFIFSGGGNDVLGGGALRALLKNKSAGGGSTDPADYLDADRLNDTVLKLRTGYMQVAAEIRVWSAGTRMLVHGYDYPVPRAGEPWLGLPFADKGYDLVGDAALIQGIIALLVDSFYAMLAGVAADEAHVTVVNLRGICTGRWNDELHPEAEASRDLADKYVEIIGAPLVA